MIIYIHSGQNKLLHMLNTLNPLPITTTTPTMTGHNQSIGPGQSIDSDFEYHNTHSKTSQSHLDTNRPISLRLTGVRGEMMRMDATTPVISGTNESSLWREQPIAGPTREPLWSGSGHSRSTSGRTSGLRGYMNNDSTEDIVRESSLHNNHRSVSGTRLSGIRGVIAKQSSTTSLPNLHCLHSRPETAVLAHGHRPVQVGPLVSDVVNLPSINTHDMEVDFDPTISDEINDSTCRPHPPNDINESLLSISHFDHSHLGQLDRRTSAGIEYWDSYIGPDCLPEWYWNIIGMA